jgi:signal transduction histidine kinase/DNA-binding response OmpR family regulator
MRGKAALWPAVAALVAGLLSIGLLAYFGIHLASNALRHEVEHRVDATSSIGVALVRSETGGLTGIVEAYATRPSLRTAFESGDRRTIEEQLRQLRRARPGIATTFASDPAGRLLAIEPATPSIVGRDFSFRDWYRGVQRTGRPYVSRAYVSQATGHPRVVAVAVPVRAQDGTELAIVVAAYSLAHIQHVADGLMSQGVQLTVTDQRGVVLAGPAAGSGLVSLRRNPQVAAALAGRSGVQTVDGENRSLFEAYRPVAPIGWTVVSSVPTDTALARVAGFRLGMWIAVGLALTLLLGVAAFMRTIWRRTRVEAELSRQVSITRAVLDAVRDAISMVDVDGKQVMANARMLDVEQEVFGDEPGRLSIEEAAQHFSDPGRYLAEHELERQNPDAELLSEYELVASRRQFRRLSAPVDDANGNRLGRISVLREVTAEREAEQLKNELVATVSHELRTPLTGVLGFAELLRQPDLDDATRMRYAATIHDEAKRLASLVDAFLDLQRIEAGALTLSVKTLDLRHVVQDAVDVFRATAGEQTLEVELPDEPVEVAADPQRLAQVLTNLLSNAIKYSPDGGTVRVTMEPADGQVRVAVCDEGIGIPAEQARQLFTKFFRVDSSDTRSIGGTGLGLSLAREIVEAHGGRMGVDTVEGEGSTFWFELPLGDRLTATRPRVLVVEDDPGAAELLVTYLGEDFEVEVAANGTIALERAQRRAPAVICLDIGLPGDLTGWHVLASLKDDLRTAQVPVIVCTGVNGHRRAGALGAADFLTKPFTRDDLLDAVTKLLPDRAAEVLVVDDAAPVRRLVAATLEAEGHTIRQAADGEEALEEIARQRPDAIVLDLMMPRLDGFEVLGRLQADPALREIPVLVLTARRLTAPERQTLGVGAVALLEKSDYSAGELRRLVRQALGTEGV